MTTDAQMPLSGGRVARRAIRTRSEGPSAREAISEPQIAVRPKLAPDVLKAIRERDAAAITYHGQMPTVAQMDRRDLLIELDRLTRELEHARGAR